MKIFHKSFKNLSNFRVSRIFMPEFSKKQQEKVNIQQTCTGWTGLGGGEGSSLYVSYF